MQRQLLNQVMAVLAVLMISLPAQAQQFAYITNQASGNVVVLDTSTNSVVSTIPLGAVWPTGIAITPNGPEILTRV